MKYLVIVILFLGFLGCSNSTQDLQEKQLKSFNDSIGTVHAEVFDELVESFDDFLKMNYPNQASQQERLEAFLKPISESWSSWYNPDWKSDTETNLRLLNKFESIGLRKEVWKYGFEHDTIYDGRIFSLDGVEEDYSLDSSSHFNMRGMFLYSLTKCCVSDTAVYGYVDARDAAGNIQWSLLAKGHLINNVSYDNPIHLRILVVDFYLDIMGWDIYRKGFKIKR